MHLGMKTMQLSWKQESCFSTYTVVSQLYSFKQTCKITEGIKKPPEVT